VTGALATSLLLAMAQALPMVEARLWAYSEPRYTGEVRDILGPLFVANWLDLNPASPLHYLAGIYLYWGVAATFAIGWMVCRRRWLPYLQPLLVMGACLFLVVDPRAVVYYTIVKLPVLESSLQSYNFFEGMSAMAALLSATALSDFFESGVRRVFPKWLAAGLVLVMAAWAMRALRIWSQGGQFASGGRAVLETAAALALVSAALWLLRAASGIRRSCLAAALFLFCLIDYKVYGTGRLFNTRDGDPDERFALRDISGINGAANQAFRANRQYRVTSDGAPSSMDFRMWGLASPQGLDPFLPRQYREMMKRSAEYQTSRVFLMDYRNEPLLQLLGVRYAITHHGGARETVLSNSPAFRLVGADDSFYRVYEYQNARPPFGWDGVAGEARPANWTPERRTFQVSSAVGGRFALAEEFLPGWQATVDGRRTAIGPWREVFQAIDVPPGQHTVTFEYHSRLLPWGAAISLASATALVWLVRRRRSGTLS
jgi:hypothetical protein